MLAKLIGYTVDLHLEPVVGVKPVSPLSTRRPALNHGDEQANQRRKNDEKGDGYVVDEIGVCGTVRCQLTDAA